MEASRTLRNFPPAEELSSYHFTDANLRNSMVDFHWVEPENKTPYAAFCYPKGPSFISHQQLLDLGRKSTIKAFPSRSICKNFSKKMASFFMVPIILNMGGS